MIAREGFSFVRATVLGLSVAVLLVVAGICDASAAVGDCGQPRTSGPAATDALIVLRVAVGENIPLVCPCVVTTSTTTTTSTTLPAPVLTSEMFVLLRREGNYATSDLAGTWDVNALGAGNLNGWSRGFLTVQIDGKFTGELEEDDGLHDNVSGRPEVVDVTFKQQRATSRAATSTRRSRARGVANAV